MTKEQAVAMCESGWWKNATPEQIVGFQLYEDRLCMDFSDFHAAISKALGRSVWTHEFGLNREGLQAEFEGKAPKATFQQIMELIPEEKRILIQV